MDYYKVLRINPNASVEEIEKAADRMLMIWDPDEFDDFDEIARKVFDDVNAARDTLLDPAKRSDYDKKRKKMSKESCEAVIYTESGSCLKYSRPWLAHCKSGKPESGKDSHETELSHSDLIQVDGNSTKQKNNDNLNDILSENANSEKEKNSQFTNEEKERQFTTNRVVRRNTSSDSFLYNKNRNLQVDTGPKAKFLEGTNRVLKRSSESFIHFKDSCLQDGQTRVSEKSQGVFPDNVFYDSCDSDTDKSSQTSSGQTTRNSDETRSTISSSLFSSCISDKGRHLSVRNNHRAENLDETPVVLNNSLSDSGIFDTSRQVRTNDKQRIQNLEESQTITRSPSPDTCFFDKGTHLQVKNSQNAQNLEQQSPVITSSSLSDVCISKKGRNSLVSNSHMVQNFDKNQTILNSYLSDSGISDTSRHVRANDKGKVQNIEELQIITCNSSTDVCFSDESSYLQIKDCHGAQNSEQSPLVTRNSALKTCISDKGRNLLVKDDQKGQNLEKSQTITSSSPSNICISDKDSPSQVEDGQRAGNEEESQTVNSSSSPNSCVSDESTYLQIKDSQGAQNSEQSPSVTRNSALKACISDKGRNLQVKDNQKGQNLEKSQTITSSSPPNICISDKDTHSQVEDGQRAENEEESRTVKSSSSPNSCVSVKNSHLQVKNGPPIIPPQYIARKSLIFPVKNCETYGELIRREAKKSPKKTFSEQTLSVMIQMKDTCSFDDRNCEANQETDNLKNDDEKNDSDKQVKNIQCKLIRKDAKKSPKKSLSEHSMSVMKQKKDSFSSYDMNLEANQETDNLKSDDENNDSDKKVKNIRRKLIRKDAKKSSKKSFSEHSMKQMKDSCSSDDMNLEANREIYNLKNDDEKNGSDKQFKNIRRKLIWKDAKKSSKKSFPEHSMSVMKQKKDSFSSYDTNLEANQETDNLKKDDENNDSDKQVRLLKKCEHGIEKFSYQDKKEKYVESLKKSLQRYISLEFQMLEANKSNVHDENIAETATVTSNTVETTSISPDNIVVASNHSNCPTVYSNIQGIIYSSNTDKDTAAFAHGVQCSTDCPLAIPGTSGLNRDAQTNADSTETVQDMQSNFKTVLESSETLSRSKTSPNTEPRTAIKGYQFPRENNSDLHKALPDKNVHNESLRSGSRFRRKPARDHENKNKNKEDSGKNSKELRAFGETNYASKNILQDISEVNVRNIKIVKISEGCVLKCTALLGIQAAGPNVDVPKQKAVSKTTYSEDQKGERIISTVQLKSLEMVSVLKFADGEECLTVFLEGNLACEIINDEPVEISPEFWELPGEVNIPVTLTVVLKANDNLIKITRFIEDNNEKLEILKNGRLLYAFENKIAVE